MTRSSEPQKASAQASSLALLSVNDTFLATGLLLVTSSARAALYLANATLLASSISSSPSALAPRHSRKVKGLSVSTISLSPVRSSPAPRTLIPLKQPILDLISVQPVAIDPIEATIRWPSDVTETAKELIEIISPTLAAKSLMKQACGYSYHGFTVRPSTTNSRGCWLSQLYRHIHGGHCRINPLMSPPKRRMKQYLHRVAVRAWGTWEQVLHLIEDQWEVSHLCHTSNCFNIRHLIVEPHEQNMARNLCVAGDTCTCLPSCIF